MKKIVTAIGSQNLNENLKTQNGIEIIGKDIQYEEGIFEILEKEKDIDFLILNKEIIQESNMIEIIEKIKLINQNIKIILILENKKEELENILIAKGIYKIIYHNQIQIKDLIDLINNRRNNENEELKKEINNLKKLIIENNNEKKSSRKLEIKKEIGKYIQKIISKKITKNNQFESQINLNSKNNFNQKKVISISGPSGVGKSIVTVNLAKSLMCEKNKILMIDFDILNNSLHTILGTKKYPQIIENRIKNKLNIAIEENKFNQINIENYIIKINKKMDLLSITELLFETKEKLSFIKIERILNVLKEKYDTIIIDTSSECFFDITKNTIQLSNKSIFITETNILEIKKSKELLNIYINEWKIEKEKFSILFNKYDKDCVNENLLKYIFSEFNIIGFLKYNAKYNKLINKNIKDDFYNKEIKDEYMKIKLKI